MSEKNLYQRWSECMGEMEALKKKGKNEFHRYAYLREADVADEMRSRLAKHGIVVAVNQVERHSEAAPGKDGKPGGFIVTVKTEYTLINIDKPEERITVANYASGHDSLDKGDYKASTGSQKYFFVRNFCLGSNDDPENDSGKQEPPAQQGSRGPAKRPTTPAPQSSGPVYYSTASLTAEQAIDAGVWLEGAGAKRVRVGLYIARKKIGPYSKTDRLLVPKPADLTEKEELNAVFNGDDLPGMNP